MCSGCGVKLLYLLLYGWRRDRHTGGMGYVDGQAHRCCSFMDSIVCYGVQPLALPSAIHLRTATMPAFTVALSANGDGSALGGSGEVGWVVYYKIKYTMGVYILPLQSMLKDACSF
jgi:hypothetical protein